MHGTRKNAEGISFLLVRDLYNLNFEKRLKIRVGSLACDQWSVAKRKMLLGDIRLQEESYFDASTLVISWESDREIETIFCCHKKLEF